MADQRKAPPKKAPTKVPTKEPIREKPSKEASSNVTTKPLSPDTYTYTTDRSVETFANVPFSQPITPRNNLAPASNFQPQTQGDTTLPPPPVSTSGHSTRFCEQYPNDPRCHDEQNPYQALGLFAEEVKYIFDPSTRSQVNQTTKPISSLYEQGRDDTQLDVGKVVRTECRCKDGSVVMGYLDTRTGQKDCSPCKKSVFNSPNIYKNYKTDKVKPIFSDKKLPIREQVGVSHFGDVNMKGCQTGNANQSLEKVNAVSTLNKVVNIDTVDSVGGANITAKQNNTGMPISMYDNDPTNIYGVI